MALELFVVSARTNKRHHHRSAYPRYITTGDDSNRGDVLLTMAQVRELITKKDQSKEGIATVWLTTTEMGFSLTDEPNAIECTKDVRDVQVSDI